MQRCEATIDLQSRSHSPDLSEVTTDVHGVDVEDVAKIDPHGHPRRNWRSETDRVPIQRARRFDQLEKACVAREKCLGHARTRCSGSRGLRCRERFGRDQHPGNPLSHERLSKGSIGRARVGVRRANERFGGREEKSVHEHKVLQYLANAPLIRSRTAHELFAVEDADFGRDALVVGAHLRVKLLAVLFLKN